MRQSPVLQRAAERIAVPREERVVAVLGLGLGASLAWLAWLAALAAAATWLTGACLRRAAGMTGSLALLHGLPAAGQWHLG